MAWKVKSWGAVAIFGTQGIDMGLLHDMEWSLYIYNAVTKTRSRTVQNMKDMTAAEAKVMEYLGEELGYRV